MSSCQLCMHIFLNVVTYTDSIIQCLYTVYSKHLIHTVQLKGNVTLARHSRTNDERVSSRLTCLH